MGPTITLTVNREHDYFSYRLKVNGDTLSGNVFSAETHIQVAAHILMWWENHEELYVQRDTSFILKNYQVRSEVYKHHSPYANFPKMSRIQRSSINRFFKNHKIELQTVVPLYRNWYMT